MSADFVSVLSQDARGLLELGGTLHRAPIDAATPFRCGRARAFDQTWLRSPTRFYAIRTGRLGFSGRSHQVAEPTPTEAHAREKHQGRVMQSYGLPIDAPCRVNLQHLKHSSHSADWVTVCATDNCSSGCPTLCSIHHFKSEEPARIPHSLFRVNAIALC